MKKMLNMLILLAASFIMFTILQTSLKLTLHEVDSPDMIRGFEERFNQTLQSFGDRISRYHAAKGLSPTGSPSDIPPLYIITPTYKRYVQIPELTRLGQTLLNVPNLHWIVADDTNVTNQDVIDLLQSLGISYTYLLTPMPEKYRDPKYKAQPKGVANRNSAIDWIRIHATTGVLYMADDDNTYDIRIFKEMRYTKKVSMFPVGFVTQAGLSTPLVKDGKFAGWYDGWIANRKFPVDMAGFAISVPFLLTKPDAKMPYSPGYQETGFLASLKISYDELEFLADNCTKIYAWHTKTQHVYASSRNVLKPEYNGTNLGELAKQMVIEKQMVIGKKK